MKSKTAQLIRQIQTLEWGLEAEYAKRRAKLRFGIERGRVRFEHEVLRRHRLMRTALLRYVMNARPLVVITAPFIYSLIIPLALLDLCVSIYQAVCFPIYGIEKVQRHDFFVFDRHHLAYLNILEKLNCAYCSYANGLINYTREIASRTEQHWCPIKHARRVLGTHSNYAAFKEYGDAKAYGSWLRKFERARERVAHRH